MKHLMMCAALTMAVSTAGATDLDALALQLASQRPELASVRATYDSELESARAANVLAGPEAEFKYVFSPEGPDGHKWEMSVGQTFDWPGVYRSRARANGYRAEAFEYLYRSQLADAVYETKQVLINLAAAREVAAILERASDNIDRMHDVIEQAYTIGNATALDLKKIHVEQFAMHSRLARARADLEGLQATVRALNGGHDVEALEALPATALPADLDTYRRAFEEGNPALKGARSLSHALAADVQAQRRAALPSFTLAYVHEYEDYTHLNGFSVGIALPSWSPRKSIRAAEAALRAADFDNKAYLLQINTELESQYATARNLGMRLSRARCAFEEGDYGELLRKALDMGVITVLEYLTEYNGYLDAAADYVEQKAELARAMAYLNRYNTQF